MKKILITSLVALSMLGTVAGVAMADPPTSAGGNQSPTNSYSIDLNDINPLGNITLKGLIDRVANWAVGLLIALSVLFIIYAAYLFMFAEGVPANVQKAKNIILYTVIAIIIALMSRAILGVVTDLLKGTGTTGVSNTLPSDSSGLNSSQDAAAFGQPPEGATLQNN